MNKYPQLDALVIATHPDDAEATSGGTIWKLVSAGKRVGILDASRGEMGTRGSLEQRRKECARATRALESFFRENLELPDGRVVPTTEARERIAVWIRLLRPKLLIAPWWRSDLHPDHAAVGLMSRQAYFLSGLRRLEPSLEPFRPSRVLYYPSHDSFEPTFVVRLDEAQFAAKLRALRCYTSQVTPQSRGDKGRHFVHGQEFLQRVEVRGRYFGSLIAAPYGEPFCVEGTLSDANPLEA